MTGHPYKSQARAEIKLALTQYESLLVTFFIPLLALIAFAKILKISYMGSSRINFLVPGTIAIAIMATGMVSLGIATGVERSYGVLKRLGTTPLSRSSLLGAKITAVGVIEAIQIVLILALGIGLSWSPSMNIAEFVIAVILSSATFAGIGLIMAGRLSSEGVLGAANGTFLFLLFFGGMIIPVTLLPSPLADLAKILPAYASAHLLFSTTTNGVSGTLGAWITLAIWAIGAPALAIKLFKYE
ncbi:MULTISPECIES: ABC transporter permease [Acidithrix]|uniref:ABC-2 family transporter protein n=1 Tax=Acidithrix ferrooxidans TaxID=1280514 RepID=A0A0D8HLH0_9ACTN|nr:MULTISPECIES: ABC transporter permease [Acidithrix]KJF17921.1 ABC-2 family transporter protein [Acidithrix ferrooxidans]CAG4933892.1 unnamed protein product [Acidithrix sp. C25]